MTKDEADFLLHHLKYQLSDNGFLCAAITAEDAQCKIREITVSQCKEYADLVLPPGKEGRVRLVLSQPFEARGYVLVATILKSIEE